MVMETIPRVLLEETGGKVFVVMCLDFNKIK